MPAPFVIAEAFAIGAVVGSFLNVVIHRVPRGESIVSPGSHCPRCEAAIRWYDNLPIVSWIVLGGRCRACRARISPRYPVVEAAAAAAAALAVQRWGLTVAGVEATVFAWIALALAFIDLDHQILPDVITLPSIGLGLLGAWLGGLTTLVEAVIGALVGAAIPAAVILVYRLLRGEEGMGWGDVKYLAAIGAVIGVNGCLWVLVVGAVLGAVVGLGLIAAGRGGARTALPFGTFLSAAVLLWLYLPPAWRSFTPW